MFNWILLAPCATKAVSEQGKDNWTKNENDPDLWLVMWKFYVKIFVSVLRIVCTGLLFEQRLLPILVVMVIGKVARSFQLRYHTPTPPAPCSSLNDFFLHPDCIEVWFLRYAFPPLSALPRLYNVDCTDLLSEASEMKNSGGIHVLHSSYRWVISRTLWYRVSGGLTCLINGRWAVPLPAPSYPYPPGGETWARLWGVGC